MFIDKTVDAFLLSNKTLIKNFLVFLIILPFIPTNLFGLNLKRTLSPVTDPIQRFTKHHLVRLLLFFLLLWACCWKRDMMLFVLIVLLMCCWTM